MKLVYAALFGLISADDTTKVWELSSTNSQKDESLFNVWYGDWATGKANARPPMRSNYIQTQAA